VRLIDHNASHLVFDVEVPTPTGRLRLRASVMVARQLLGDAQLRSWSDEELAFLFFMSSRVPTCYKLTPGTTWAAVAHLLSGEQIADKLQGATGVAHGRHATTTAIRVIRDHCQPASSACRTSFVHGSLVPSPFSAAGAGVTPWPAFSPPAAGLFFLALRRVARSNSATTTFKS
jgi:hypothetical protein